MANPFNIMNPTVNYMGNIQQAYKALVNAKNPMQLFSYMAANNPQLQPVLNALQSGMSPQVLFNNLCQQRGIDPNSFLKQIQGNNN